MICFWKTIDSSPSSKFCYLINFMLLDFTFNSLRFFFLLLSNCIRCALIPFIVNPMVTCLRFFGAHRVRYELNVLRAPDSTFTLDQSLPIYLSGRIFLGTVPRLVFFMPHVYVYYIIYVYIAHINSVKQEIQTV